MEVPRNSECDREQRRHRQSGFVWVAEEKTALAGVAALGFADLSENWLF